MVLFEPSSHLRRPAWGRKRLRLIWALRVSAGSPGWRGGWGGGGRAVFSTAWSLAAAHEFGRPISQMKKLRLREAKGGLLGTF